MQKYQKSWSDLLSQLELCCVDLGEKLNVEKRVRDIKTQNEDLSRSLSHLKSQIFEEKELNLRLRSEIATLQLQEIVDHKKIQTLLGFCNLDEATVELFIQKDWTHFVPSDSRSLPADFGLQTENEILNIKMKALKAELNERTELLLCERDALIHDKLNLLREAETRKSQNNQIMNSLMERLKQIQSAIQNVPDLPSLTKVNHRPDSSLPIATLKEKESVGSQTNLYSEPQIQPKHITTHSKSLSSHYASVIKDLQSRLKRSEEGRQRLKNRIVVLQNELSKMSKPKQSSNTHESLVERIRILTERNKELETRRKLENEGFRSDVRILRENLKEIEKQLLKIVLVVGDAKGINVDVSACEAFEKSMRGTDELLIKLKDIQTKLQ